MFIVWVGCGGVSQEDGVDRWILRRRRVDDCKKLTVWRLNSVSNGGEEVRVAECPRCVKGLECGLLNTGVALMLVMDERRRMEDGAATLSFRVESRAAIFFCRTSLPGQAGGALVQVQEPLAGKEVTGDPTPVKCGKCGAHSMDWLLALA